MGKKRPKTSSQVLESMNEFLLGREPDFKRMPASRVASYLKKNGLHASCVFAAARAALREARRRL